MAWHEPPQVLPRKRRSGVHNRKHKIAAYLLLLLGASLVLAGCGSYASEAEKYLTQGRSEVLGSAYTLERFGDGEVSGPFVRASLQQYAKAMKSTAQSINSLKPPPGARGEHQRHVEAISRARSLLQRAGESGVAPQRAPQLAQELREIAQKLKKQA